MSKLNISELRQEAINFKKGLIFDSNSEFIDKIITFYNMFEAIEQSCCNHEMGMMPQLQLHRVIEHFKELYFPKPISRKDKINKMIECLKTPGISPDKRELIDLLIVLRDEVKNV